MGLATRWRACGAAAAALLLALAPSAAAEPFERPPSFEAGRIKGIKRAGENYAIGNPVPSDGLYRRFRLKTPYGNFSVQGDHMLRMRLHELAAVRQLEKISQTEQFSRALLLAGLSPVTFAGKMLADPARTLHDTFAGVGSFLDSVEAGAAHAGKTRDDVAAGLLGISKERRQLAARLGVDPYTDFPPLAEKLTQLSEAAALGGLAVTGAMFAIPGAAGIVVSNLSTAERLGDNKIDELARDRTASQIFELNRRRLEAIGVDPSLTETLLTNRHFTPIDLAVTVAALDGMHGVRDRALFVRPAAAARSRSEAFALRKLAEMMAVHARGGSFVRLVSAQPVPLLQGRDGHLVAILPADAVAWTAATAGLLRVPGPDGGEWRITGSATPLARQRLQERGWRLVEDAKF